MASPSLAEIQKWMKSRIRQSEGDETSLDSFENYLNPQGGEPGVERIAVYAGGLIARTEEAFSEVYEAIRFVIGAARFHELAHAYSRHYPSAHYNLTYIGRRLAEFLKSPDCTDLMKDFPFLSDLARLEWQVTMAFHAFDEGPMDPSRLKEITPEAWEKIRFIFQPSVSVMTSAWPVLDIWQARKLSIQQVDIDLVDRPQSILISRQGVKVQCGLISEESYFLLEKLLSKISLGEALEALAEMPNMESLPLAAWFSEWAEKGLFKNFNLSAD
ncbi:MAG: putative DNA-binding domain-containing protein [Candidatus Omnitrophica bacterium]|nr:putative DNA-binding domain-containing protein [Candidatus Omnitrophota bacterium]